MDAKNASNSSLNLTFVFFITTLVLSMSSIIASSAGDSGTNNNPPAQNATQTYIKTACNTTTYPSICYKSLYPYASQIESDPLKLCNASLSLALKAARSASSAISLILKSNNLTKIAEEVVHDCFDNLKESIGEMQDSLNTLGHLYNSTDKNFAMSNIKTWVSAAITDDETCSDGFEGEKNVDSSVRNKIRKIVLNVARMTSNALFFINHLSYH